MATDGVSIGWSFSGGVFTHPPAPPPTDAEVSANNVNKLADLTALSFAQKNALNNRIATLKDAVELELATDAETAELTSRQSQLTEWKKYGIFLGRVPQQEGWPLNATWPDQPAAGMDV
nr:tail fiber assembly protein [Pseudomonas guariconensis]